MSKPKNNVSDNFADDQTIIQYCSQNISDKDCYCMFPEEGIRQLQVNLFNPYQCWYAPCKISTAYKTSLMKYEEDKCNINICNVELGDVSINADGKLTIRNDCVTSQNFSKVNISQELVEQPLVDTLELPNPFIPSFLPVIVAGALVLFTGFF